MRDMSGSPTAAMASAPLGGVQRVAREYATAFVGSTKREKFWVPRRTGSSGAKFHGGWIVNNGYDRALAERTVREGKADAVAFGMDYIANPDLVRRLRDDAPLNEVNRDTLYGGGAEGYIDYPTLEEVDALV